MSDHLRFTPDEYESLQGASHCLPLNTSYSDFQRRLADELRPALPALACRIVGLRTRQVRTLRMHFEEQRQQATPPVTTPCEISLTYDERRAISRAYALILLRGKPSGPFKEQFLTAVHQEMPELAKKLGPLDVSQVAAIVGWVQDGGRF
jgi:hypothetical protein